MSRTIIISNSTELLRIPIDNLLFVKADGNYSTFVTKDKSEHVFCIQLGKVENEMNEQLGNQGGNLVRIGKSLIINLNYVYLIDIAKQKLVLSDCSKISYDLEASREALKSLK
ncbi:MAG: LytTR family transcriptional regulator, partial [Bacteroidales bacterium]|nr:LytTR family transcriptional regulator [Bacteroidales bacterium]